MCGICLVLNIPIDNHHINFDFFKPYNYNDPEVLPLNKHIQHHKLKLNNHIDFAHIHRFLSQRGPNKMISHAIDMYKTNYHPINHQIHEINIGKGHAIGIQSTLHLRGSQFYECETPGSYFLYNGEIWETGNLSPIDEENGENDSSWLHRTLSNCKGSEEKMLEVLNEIRGDFAIILIEGDQIFIMKDYFGKRSLLVGMSDDHLVISSIPVEPLSVKEQQNAENNNGQEENEQNWKSKYEAQWLSSKGKHMFQIPANSLISINLRNGEAMWTYHKIYNINLKQLTLSKQEQIQQHVISTVKKLLVESVREITRCVKGVYKDNYQKIPSKEGPKIAVLFSGGIDSTLIARLLDLTLPKDQQIDLINLAFREDAPDRQTGKISYEELKHLSHRKFNLILLDRNLEDIENIKQQLALAIYPKTTHMDFNIAAALHLASKATSAKIILTGLGADQIFGGYSRYKIAFKRAGFDELQNEMIFDMERLWIRNLGRDDRAIGMNSKEVRYPFLYIPLWKYLRTVQINMLTQGSGEKLLLRKIAKQFGLEKASAFKKKAIQFGTRLAKLSNVKSFGSNRKARGVYEYKL